VTGDVRRMHLLPESAGALFQLASQFNLLEMTGPEVTPENGVTIYQHDHTQGPACAIRRRSGYDLSQLTRCKSGPMHEGLFRRNRGVTPPLHGALRPLHQRASVCLEGPFGGPPRVRSQP
jgi:hypothetical protein